MDTDKVQQLIAELEADIRIREEALRGLRKLLMPYMAVGVENLGTPVATKPILFSGADSYVDLAVKIITANDFQPMSMKDITDRIRVLKSNPNIERRSVEATLTQHVSNKGDESRVMRVGRGIWGVRRFPRETSAA